MQATDKDRETLKQLRLLTTQKGYPPTVRELGKALGLLSSNTTQKRLERLVGLGLIERAPTSPRAIRITDE